MQINKTVKAVFGVAMAAVLLVGTSASAYTFTSSLKLGSKGTAVKELQKVLNMSADTQVATAGKAGSPGMETTTFGPATKSALQKFQAKNNLSPLTGATGPGTRAALNAISNGSTPTTPTTPAQTGPVTAMLATTSPASGTVLDGSNVELAQFTFSGTGTVQNITFQRSGLSLNTDLTNVYLYDGATRLTDGASVNSTGVITFNNVNLMVSGSRTISVRADIPATTADGHTVGVNLTSYTVGGSTSTVNIIGNAQYIQDGSGLLATVSVGANTAPGGDINAGVMQQTLWSAPFQVSTHAVTLKSIGFHYVGSAPTDSLANIKLYVNGSPVATSAGVNSLGYIVFDMTSSPVAIATGSKTVEVRADVVKGSNRSFSLTLQYAADLMASDETIKSNVSASGTIPSTSSAVYNILSGTVTVNIDPSFTSVTNVTGGATNTAIAKYQLRAYGEDVKVTSLQVTPAITNGTTASGSTTQFNNVALYYNGSQIGSSQNFTGSTLTFQLGSSMILTANANSTLEVRADLQNEVNSNYTAGTIAVTLEGATNLENGQGISSLISTIDVPSSDKTTTGLTIQTGTLALGKSASYANQTLNPNTSSAKIASFTLQNQSSSESVRVTNLAVALTSDGSTAATAGMLANLSNLKTSETSGSGANPINPQASNNFSVDFTIAPGATKTVEIMADLGTWNAGSVYATLLPTAVGASSNVTLTPSAATVGQAITLSGGTFGTPSFLTSSSTTTQYVAANGGAVDGSKATFKFTSTNGSATVSELKFSVTGAGTISSLRIGSQTASVQLTPATTTTGAVVTAASTVALTSASGVSVGTVLTIDSEDMLVTSISGLTATVTRAINSTTAAYHASAAAVTVNGLAYFTGLNLAVPNGGSGLSIDVYPTYASVGTNGVTSGTSSQIGLSYNKYTIGGTTTGAAVNPTSITSPVIKVVGSKPTITIGSTPTNKLSAGTIEAIDITVAANAKGDITLNSLPVTVTLNAATMATAATVVVKDAGNNSITTTNTTFSSYVGGTSTISFTGGYLIQAGTSQTFRIYVPVTAVTGTGVNGASMASALGASTFAWTDTAGGGSYTSGTTYMYNYPSTQTSVIYN